MSETQETPAAPRWRTHRLELDDQTLREWDAVVLDASDVRELDAAFPLPPGNPPLATA